MNPWPDKFPLFPQSASTLAPEVDRLYFFGLTVAAIFSLLIAVVILRLAIKYRRRSADEVGIPEKEAIWLEITWSVIPLGILLFMFAWGATVFYHARRPPADALELYATARQWMWKFQHPQGNREINELHVPLGQPIKITMTSEDVIHDFFVPAFRVKMDVLPGRYTQVWFQATKTGTFHLFCNEYCGAEHSMMIGSVIVMEPAAYEEWLAGGQAQPAAALSGPDLFAKNACNTCHRPDSVARAPQLAGLFGSEVELADGSRVIADENYVRESILNPQAKVVAGFNPIMPTYAGRLSEEDLLQLIIYIKEQAGEHAAPASAETPSPAAEG